MGFRTSLCAPLAVSFGSLTQVKVSFPLWLDLDSFPQRDFRNVFWIGTVFLSEFLFYILISSSSPVVPMNVNLWSASLDPFIFSCKLFFFNFTFYVEMKCCVINWVGLGGRG